MKYSPTVIDLFCGCGGMSWGLYKKGFNILLGIDMWDKALATFEYNHHGVKSLNTDISKLDPREIREGLKMEREQLDVIVGGPPCQGFSKNVPASYRFLEDDRNQLYKSYLSFVDEFRPKVVVMENVAEIYNAFNGVVRDEVITKLEELGYQVEVSVVNVSDWGIPQKRRRCLFFASRTGVHPRFPLVRLQEKPSAWSAISDLPVLDNGEGYEPMPYTNEPLNEYQNYLRGSCEEIYDHITRVLRDTQYERVCALPPGGGWKDLPKHLQPKSGYSGAYGRLDFEMISPTITRWVFHSGSGRYCHPREPRLITMREAARIQSFSDDFRFLGSYVDKAGQIGNAVPPLVMEKMAHQILHCLSIIQDIEISGHNISPHQISLGI